jgi:hypothetical protein
VGAAWAKPKSAERTSCSHHEGLRKVRDSAADFHFFNIKREISDETRLSQKLIERTFSWLIFLPLTGGRMDMT